MPEEEIWRLALFAFELVPAPPAPLPDNSIATTNNTGNSESSF